MTPFSVSRRHTVAFGLALAAGLLALGDRAQAKRVREISPVATPVTTTPELLLRMDRNGGLMPWSYLITRIPSFSLFDDGSLYRLGPQIAIDPPPALPNLTRMRLTEAGMAIILDQALAAGLTQAQAIVNDLIMDAPTTQFLFRVDDQLVKTTVSALIEDAITPDDWDEETREHYQQLADLQSFLFGIDLHLPADAIAELELPIDPERLQLLVIPATEDDTRFAAIVDTTQPAIVWPLETSLATSGTPLGDEADGPGGARCVVLAGDDAAAVIAAARTGSFVSPWTDRGETFAVLLRPLLPDETGCQ